MEAQTLARPAAGEAPIADWSQIRQPERSFVIEPRQVAALAGVAQPLASGAPFERRGAGPVDEALAALGDMPAALRADIRDLATRFACLMAVPAVRIRLEVINTNACRKIHADYTDVRLITTYWGPGTDYVPAGMEPVETSLVRLPAGHIGLFKGRLFEEGDPPCLHRSPPVGDTGEQRLVLVIDTPLDEARISVVLPPSEG